MRPCGTLDWFFFELAPAGFGRARLSRFLMGLVCPVPVSVPAGGRRVYRGSYLRGGSIADSAQHFGSASVVTGMDDYMLRMVKMRGEELMREARRDGRAAEARRAARTRQTVPAAARRPVPAAARRPVPAAARRLVLRPARWLVLRPARWLAMAAARMRPTTMGR
jgi:hypothetical protein